MGVIYGIEFLGAVNLGEKVDIGGRVVVIGGGNAAFDAARVARRLGSAVGFQADEGDVVWLHQHSRPGDKACPLSEHTLECGASGMPAIPGSEAANSSIEQRVPKLTRGSRSSITPANHLRKHVKG